ncbi:RNA 2',3'-cyclic phosphodiesterase [Bacteroidota bacterium]
MIRLFIAAKIPLEVIEYLINSCKKIAPNPNDYRWESPPKIHLTLKFIGEIDEHLLSEIGSELDFVSNYIAFEFSLTKFGFFFRDNAPKILWAGLETHESIHNLVEELNQRLSKFSIPVENRKFKPHLTMLRIKNDPGADFIDKFRQYSFDEYKFISREIILVKSRLLTTGAQYTEIKNYNLK